MKINIKIFLKYIMTTLTQIANKYYTDKSTSYTNKTLFKQHDGFFNGKPINAFHNYCEQYENFFNKYKDKKSVYILEIGPGAGGSTLMFDEYFNHKCEIFCLDINKLEFDDDIDIDYYSNIHIIQLDQSDNQSLLDFANDMKFMKVSFDIIIDDGSHLVNHQMQTYKYFVDLLEQDGIYIIEDVHISHNLNIYNNIWGNKNNHVKVNPIDFFIHSIYYDKFDNNTNSHLLNNIKDVVLINNKNISNNVEFNYSFQKDTAFNHGMSLIISHKIPKYKFYACSYDGNDYTDRLPNIYHEVIDYKDCNNDLDDIKLLYSELYHIYDIWKNRELNDYIGICHYRRFFYKFDYNELNNIWNNYDIVLPQAYDFGVTVYNQYCRNFDPNNIKILGAIIKKYYPDYLDAFCEFSNQNKIHANNMMITSKEIFNDYCTWVFDILDKFSKYCKFNTIDDVREYIMKNDNNYHCEDGYLSVLDKEKLSPTKYEEWLNNYSRIYGFLGERLLNVYVMKNKLRVFEVPVKIYD